MLFLKRTTFVFILLACVNAYSAVKTEQHFDNVLGTSLDITLYTDNQKQANQAISAAVREIKKLEDVLSTYKKKSEISKLNKRGKLRSPSATLQNVFRLCEQWLQKSEERFSCRMGKIKNLWRKAEAKQVIPDRMEVRHIARRAKLEKLDLSNISKTIILPKTIELDTDGLAKGYIIDQALKVLRQKLPNAQAIKVDIGGDSIYWGTPPGTKGWKVAIANPIDTADNAEYLAQLLLNNKAIASSGHNTRFRTIKRRQFSHIYPARDGWPMDDAPAVTVIADNATTADAIATALSSFTITQGTDWVNDLDGVEALWVSPEGRQFTSEGWYQQTGVNTGDSGGFSLKLEYTIPNLKSDRYERPYVYIWVTDNKRKLIKNLLLLGESHRWAQENTRWWRRVGRIDETVLDGVARPSRRPGMYHLQWSGRDSYGKPVPEGEYILHMEASREHGGHDYQRVKFKLDASEQNMDLPVKGELGETVIKINNPA